MNSHTILGRLCLDSLYRTWFFDSPKPALAGFPLPLLGAERDGLEHMGTDQPLAGQLEAKFQEIGQLLAGVGCTTPPCPWPKFYTSGPVSSHTIMGWLCLDEAYRVSFFASPAQALADFPLPLLEPEQDGLVHMGTDQPLAAQLQTKFEEIGGLLAGVGCTNPPCPWPRYYVVVPPSPNPQQPRGERPRREP